MYEVDMEIGGSQEGYWAMLRFEDRQGKIHKREFKKERKAEKNSNVLQAALEAFRILQIPCDVNIFTESVHVLEPIRNGWLAKWENNGWRNAEGKTIRNASQWQQLSVVISWHYITLYGVKGEQ